MQIPEVMRKLVEELEVGPLVPIAYVFFKEMCVGIEFDHGSFLFFGPQYSPRPHWLPVDPSMPYTSIPTRPEPCGCGRPHQ